MNPADGSRVTTLTTDVQPPDGWGALSMRGDHNDLLACANNLFGTDLPHDVYTINIDPNDSIADGHAEPLFTAMEATGEGPCDGVAWDASDETIYVSPDLSDTVYHYDLAGNFLNSIATPPGCPNNSGVAVSGASLFLACNGDLVMYQVDKVTGDVINSFGTGDVPGPDAPERPEDVECDPYTFAADRKAAVWTKDAFTNRMFAFEVPVGSCGPAGGLPPVAPGACPGGDTTDTDGDGLLDCWETDGIDFDGDGTPDLDLYDVNGDGTIQPDEAADPNQKDLYVEIDWMDQHEPLAGAIADVIAGFAAAPVTNPGGAPNGIRLHVQVNEQALAHNDHIAFTPCTAEASGGIPDYDATKNASFGTDDERTHANSQNILNAKRLVFRYGISAHYLHARRNGSSQDGFSGCAEISGNDFVVTLGGVSPTGWAATTDGTVTRTIWAGTIMHEFGHTLDLRHGGGDHINYKPNHISVMNYSRQTAQQIPTRALEFSESVLVQLKESGGLDETAGVGGPAGEDVAFYDGATAAGRPANLLVVPADQPINWNRDSDSNDTGVTRDVNGNGRNEDLNGFNEWAALAYDPKLTLDYADGVHLTALLQELPAEEVRSQPMDTDGDGIDNIDDNCIFVRNPFQIDRDGNGVGDRCEARPKLDCVERGRHGTFTAFFGYDNPNVDLAIPVGGDNRFVFGSADRGQLTFFQRGRVFHAFSVSFRASERLVWLLNGAAAVASAHSRSCDRRHPRHHGHHHRDHDAGR